MKAASFLPANAVIELTYRCCHSCIFCSCPWFSPRKDFETLPELTTRQWKGILDELCSCGVSSVAFTGGEAMLREDCLELLEYTSRLKTEKTETSEGRLVTRTVTPDIYLLSCGSAITETVLDRLAELDVKLSISMPGYATYSRHTGSSSLEHILDLFSMASERGIPTTVNSTVTALNIHELKRTLSAAFLAGAGQLLLNRFLPGGRGLKNKDSLVLTAAQTIQMLKIADDVLTRAGRAGNLGTEIPLCLLDEVELKTLKVGTRCSAAVKFFVIGPSGYVRVCNHSPVRLDHFHRWRNLRQNEYWRTFTMRKYLPGECGECGLKLDCDGGCREAAHIAGGRVDSPDPLMLSFLKMRS
ncbi:MAG: radical SAM protein [Candidatus Aegiribacteria sp.]|nr:radical SAM protein [Candidatus Aegiribacteria sp.]MBD3293856.1 radical SAM protein [Candidatus Fermentibacteria bacterium]